MKQLVLFFSLFMAISFFQSCEDEPYTPVNTNHFQGTWINQDGDQEMIFYSDGSLTITNLVSGNYGDFYYTYDDLEINIDWGDGTDDDFSYEFMDNYQTMVLTRAGYTPTTYYKQ